MMKSVKALDGMRGLAILVVILFHYGYLGVGWAGVQYFFVLSGFLITSILIHEAESPLGFYLKRFYWRRVLRIFPLYFTFLFALALLMMWSKSRPAFHQQWLSLYTYTFNFWDLFPRWLFPKYWQHLWSLCLEEQFYLVWPLVVYFTPAPLRKRVLWGILILCPVLRGLTAMLLVPRLPHSMDVGNAVFHLTCCQWDAFAAGALIATIGATESKNNMKLFTGMSAVVLFAGLANLLTLPSGRLLQLDTLGYPVHPLEHFQHIWGYTFQNMWAASLILVLQNPSSLTHIFEQKWLVHIGKISYGMYIYHYPLLKLINWRLPHDMFWRLLIFIAYFAVLWIISELSYSYFESWFLRLKEKFFVVASPPRVFASDQPL